MWFDLIKTWALVCALADVLAVQTNGQDYIYVCMVNEYVYICNEISDIPLLMLIFVVVIVVVATTIDAIWFDWSFWCYSLRCGQRLLLIRCGLTNDKYSKFVIISFSHCHLVFQLICSSNIELYWVFSTFKTFKTFQY